MPLAINPAAAATSSTRPSRGSSMPVVLASRLTSRTPSPPLRNSETGAAPRISSSTSSSRSRSMTAPAAAASTVLGCGGRNDRVGRRQLHRAGLLAAQHLPDVAGQDHRLGVDPSQQTHRQQLRHRPIRRRRRARRRGYAPSGSLRATCSSTSRWAWSSPSIRSAICSPLRAASSSVTCPGCHGNAAPASAATRTAVSPQARARCLRSSSAPTTSASGSAVADQRQQLGRRHRCRYRPAAPAARRAPPAARSRARRWRL